MYTLYTNLQYLLCSKGDVFLMTNNSICEFPSKSERHWRCGGDCKCTDSNPKDYMHVVRIIFCALIISMATILILILNFHVSVTNEQVEGCLIGYHFISSHSKSYLVSVVVSFLY